MGRRAMVTWCVAGIAFLGAAGVIATDTCEHGVIAQLLVGTLCAAGLLTACAPDSGEDHIVRARERLARALMATSSEAAFIVDGGYTIR